MLIIFILNSLSDSSNIYVISESILMLALSFQTMFFYYFLAHLVIFFLLKGRDVSGNRNCSK